MNEKSRKELIEKLRIAGLPEELKKPYHMPDVAKGEL